jgi:predicted ArsR family transcriptional regulator
MELRVVAGRSRTQAGRPYAVFMTADANSHIPCHAHAALCRSLEKSLSERHGRGMTQARHGRGKAV